MLAYPNYPITKLPNYQIQARSPTSPELPGLTILLGLLPIINPGDFGNHGNRGNFRRWSRDHGDVGDSAGSFDRTCCGGELGYRLENTRRLVRPAKGRSLTL